LTNGLKWSLLDVSSTAQVLDLGENNEPQWFPLLAEPHHAVAAEPITSPPRSRMLVVLDLVEYSERWQDFGDEAPAPLLVENLDGQPISIAQFVTGVHDYTLRLRDVIYEIEDRADSEKAVLYFLGASGLKRKDEADANARFAVHFASDVLEDGGMLESLWALNVRRFVEQQRRNFQYWILGPKTLDQAS
jgi:hypothetical protein